MAGKKTGVSNYSKIEQQIWQICEPLVASCAAELIDIEFVKEAGSWYLRLFIDRETAVDHDLCEAVSNLVSEKLDQCDPIEQSYYLEVSSPGIERPLRREKDFIRFTGKEIVVKLYAPKYGQKEYSGRLTGVNNNHIIIEKDQQQLSFSLNEVAKAHLKADI